MGCDIRPAVEKELSLGGGGIFLPEKCTENYLGVNSLGKFQWDVLGSF